MNERREQILGAMERCITRDGWERTTIEEIAREAQLSKGAVYVHYQTKRGLMIGLLERNQAEIEELARSLSLDALRNLVVGDLSRGTGEDGWHHSTGVLELYIAATRDPDIRIMFSKSFTGTVDAIAAMIRDRCPHLTPQEARLWSMELLALIRGTGVMQAVGVPMTKSEIGTIFDRHFARLDPA